MAKTLRIGTRDSALAMWQAKTVQSQLAAHGIASELVPVKSLGDLKLDQPLYELGVTGVFTKTLDLALLAGEIDLAVHSYKDVPTVLAKGLSTAAVLKRASTADVLVHKSPDFTTSGLQIATSSLRRKAQWLAKYPEHQLVDIRGNVQTRLEKLANNSWGGAIFAAAGLAGGNADNSGVVRVRATLCCPFVLSLVAFRFGGRLGVVSCLWEGDNLWGAHSLR